MQTDGGQNGVSVRRKRSRHNYRDGACLPCSCAREVQEGQQHARGDQNIFLICFPKLVRVNLRNCKRKSQTAKVIRKSFSKLLTPC